MADPILIGFLDSGTVTFDENTVNAGAQVIDSSVTDFSNDADNFDGGMLTLEGGEPEDIWSINHEGFVDEGDIGFDGTTVFWSGDAIGTAAGGNGTDLVITFNATAKAAAIEHLIENLTYQTLSDSPTASRTAQLVIKDAEGDSLTYEFELNVTPGNDPVKIISDGGGDTAKILAKEGAVGTTTVEAKDPDPDAVIGYSIIGGDDQLLFDIDPVSGKLTFKSPPNFEKPTDTGGDNKYEVTVRATSGVDTDDQTIQVKIQDVIEGTNKNDGIKGTKKGDIIDAGKGNDKVDGGKGDDQIDGGKGKDDLKGGGGNDIVKGGNGGDKIKGGKGKDQLKGGKKNDEIKGGKDNDELSGDKGKDNLDGGSGNDDLNGGSGKDNLKGGSGKDVLSGDKGKDTLTGGKGNDIFNFNFYTNNNKKMSKNKKKIKDFKSEKDKIALELKAFKALDQKDVKDVFHLGKKAAKEDHHLLYEKKKGILRYDEDGKGGKDAVIIAELEEKAPLIGDDFLII